jgi:hypothetical protein
MHAIRNGVYELGVKTLGLTSLAIGAAELAAPRQVQEMMGLEDRPEHRGILQVLGVRELMHGVGLLAGSPDRYDEVCGVKARVAGDVLDTVLLAAAAKKTRDPAKFALVAAVVSAIGVLDWLHSSRPKTAY